MLMVAVPRAALAADDAVEPVVVRQGSGVSVQILPQVELITGVLSLTSWMDEYGPVHRGNRYFRDIQELFHLHYDHEAVQIAEDMLDRGFIHDLMPGLAFRLDSPPDLRWRYPVDQRLLVRAGGIEALEGFRGALEDLFAASEFTDFLREHRPLYETLVEEAAEEVDGRVLVEWIEGFFGWSASEYKTVLAPATFPAGGYGVMVTFDDGSFQAVGIIRASSAGEGPPVFPRGESLAGLMLHEWGHSFVDPTLLEYTQQVRRLEFLFEPVEDRMRVQAYTNVYTWANEQVLRAVCALAVDDLFGSVAYEQEISVNESRGFYLTRHLSEYLRTEYVGGRHQYETFDDFAPVLLEHMTHIDPDGFLPGFQPVTLQTLPYVLMGAVVLVSALWWVAWGLRRRRERIEAMDEVEEWPGTDDPTGPNPP